MKNNYNYGLALIRIFFVFMVVLFHYHGLENAPYAYYFLREDAVPVFIFLSFFLCSRLVDSKDKEKYKNRIVRLIIPYLSWSIIYFVISQVSGFIFETQRATFKDLLISFAVGNCEMLDPPLWYMWILIVLTCLFLLLRYICNDKALVIILCMLSLVCYILLYTNINANIFVGLGYEIEGSAGRLAEVFPCAALGYLYGKFGVAEKLKSNKKITIPIFLVLSIMVVLFAKYIPSPETTFCYSGIKYLIGAFAFVSLAYIIDFDKLPSCVLKVIKFLADLTMGVYALNWIVGKGMNSLWMSAFGVEKTFVECICIYFVCILIAWLISLIPIKYTKMLVR